MNKRIALKSFLWLVVGIWITVSLARFFRGLGATTNLSDAAPWGLWIAFDVMSGVALAAGGFVIAAVVYIFHLKKYKLFTRPAILTAFLGYTAVAVGLLYDLGVPLNIWHPIIYPQPHSVLFEVAMCVMLYLTVLFLEFCPVILEHPKFSHGFFRRIHAALKRAVIPLVILGIVLSTLHQSSLGSLFLIVPERVHPLWYSPILWILFFVSAVGLGLMTIVAEAIFSSWYFGHKLRVDLLSKLGQAASFILFLYAGLRLADLALRGKIGYALENTWQAHLFWLELITAALLPATLMAFQKIRSSAAGIGIASGLTLLGIMGYRFNLSIVAFYRPGSSYFPSWMEFAVTFGIVAAALLVFIFFVEHLQVCEDGHEEDASAARPVHSFNPYSLRIFMPELLAGARRYSLALVMGLALAAAALPRDVWHGSILLHTPVQGPMIVEGMMVKDLSASKAPSYQISLQQPGPTNGSVLSSQLFLIDGNRNNRLVAFPHQFHSDKLGGKDSCVLCHHQNMPFHQNSSCAECHRDMYLTTDIFNHSAHIARLDGTSGCSKCHDTAARVKTRETAKACDSCHHDWEQQSGSIVRPKQGGNTGEAVGYLQAMHGLCITCHKQKLEEEPQRYRSDFADCATCHRDVDGRQLRRMSPYAARGNDLTAKAEHLGGKPE